MTVLISFFFLSFFSLFRSVAKTFIMVLITGSQLSTVLTKKILVHQRNVCLANFRIYGAWEYAPKRTSGEVKLACEWGAAQIILLSVIHHIYNAT